jgi:hypothetical protein
MSAAPTVAKFLLAGNVEVGIAVAVKAGAASLYSALMRLRQDRQISRIVGLILCRTAPHRRFRTTVITHRGRSGAFHGFSCASVQCHVMIAHLAGLRDGVAAAKGDLQGRNQNEKPDPRTSGDHMGQISHSNPGSKHRRKRALQSALTILLAVGVILR